MFTVGTISVSINLADCEKEQIHIPNLIQPHGLVISFDKATRNITRISSNLSLKSEIEPISLIGKNLSEIFSTRLLESLLVQIVANNFKRYTLFTERVLKITEEPCDILLCEAGSEVIIELLPSIIDSTDSYFTNNKLNEIVRRLITTQEVFSLFEEASKEIKVITGYDRVLIYKFDEEFNGEVVAESKEEFLESYLHLHYPASDIPSQARE